MPKRLDIRLIAPSGYAADRAACHRGIERLQAAGHRVQGEAVVERTFLRFAGSDAERAADINQLADVTMPLPDMVMATCGGYGAIALLDLLDYDGLARRFREQPCVFVGHGDFTAIQCALYARSGIGSLHGPMLLQDFGATYLRESTWRHFWQTATSPRTEVSWLCAEDQPDLRVEGTIWGGNLSTVCSLIGTPYLPEFDGGILYVEETGEQAWRVERMLYELKLAGVLDRQRAILIGGLSGQRVSEYDNGYDTDHALQRFGDACGLPILRGLAFGHGPDKWTLPFGAQATVDVLDGTAHLTASGYRHAGEASSVN
ncbi:MAG: LD-carboxypeptidase [Luteibacter jiangsuensis]